MAPGDNDQLVLEQRLDGEDGRLGVEGVEDRLDQQQVGAAVDQPAGLLEVGVDQLDVGDVASGRVVDVGGDGGRAVGGTERAGDVARIRSRRGSRVAAG